jgi:two-component system, OmpR family, phosphate regulon response regulator OmpR
MNKPLLPHILVVDDDDRLRDLLRRYLTDNGFIVNTACDGKDALEKLQSLIFDLIVLDVMMPGMNGFELTAQLRGKECFTPVLLLTAMGEAEDRISGLETGADDYLTKPFEPRELVLRIRSILRRMPQEKDNAGAAEVIFGDYRFDLQKNRLFRESELIHLTTQEQDILQILAGSAGRPVSREILAQAGSFTGNERSVDVQINRLRKKLESRAGRPQHIMTVRGSGYVLQVD